jgi:cation-transporting ATPase 13A1
LQPGHEEDLEDDSRFQWVTPDETVRLPFNRGRPDAVSLAAQWDLCISGDGLHHLQQIGADATYVALAQVCDCSPQEYSILAWPLFCVA